MGQYEKNGYWQPNDTWRIPDEGVYIPPKAPDPQQTGGKPWTVDDWHPIRPSPSPSKSEFDVDAAIRKYRKIMKKLAEEAEAKRKEEVAKRKKEAADREKKREATAKAKAKRKLSPS